MIPDKFLQGNVLLGGKQQIDAKNSHSKFFESALYVKSVSIQEEGSEKEHIFRFVLKCT